jgi:hypothetical protein
MTPSHGQQHLHQLEGLFDEFQEPPQKEMNRAVRKMHQRRCALKNTRGGGFDVGMSAPIVPVDGAPLPTFDYYSECYDQMRPGELVTAAQPELAQVVMAGGNRRGCGCGLWKGGSRRRAHRQGCGLMKGGRASRRQGCGLMKGGRSTRRSQRGGNKGGFGVDPAMSVGGDGPIAEPVRMAIPCDARAGTVNPFATHQPVDVRASPLWYSASANQVGGNHRDGPAFQDFQEARVPNFAYTVPSTTPFAATQAGGAYSGNAYDASCYRAPGSEMPVYPAQSVGFHFTPSTAAGSTLPDGVTAFNEVVQHDARMGGAYRRKTYRKARKAAKKSRKGRKASKKSRKGRKTSRRA